MSLERGRSCENRLADCGGEIDTEVLQKASFVEGQEERRFKQDTRSGGHSPLSDAGKDLKASLVRIYFFCSLFL